MSVGRPQMDGDPRLDFAVLLKMLHPEWTIQRIARECGNACKIRVRNELVDEGLVEPLPRKGDTLAAPGWYERPCGRVQALRRAHGIEVTPEPPR